MENQKEIKIHTVIPYFSNGVEVFQNDVKSFTKYEDAQIQLNINKMTKGYLNIGASNKDEAKSKIGIQLLLKDKPNFIRRFFYWACFKIYWIDEVKE